MQEACEHDSDSVHLGKLVVDVDNNTFDTPIPCVLTSVHFGDLNLQIMGLILPQYNVPTLKIMHRVVKEDLFKSPGVKNIFTGKNLANMTKKRTENFVKINATASYKQRRNVALQTHKSMIQNLIALPDTVNCTLQQLPYMHVWVTRTKIGDYTNLGFYTFVF